MRPKKTQEEIDAEREIRRKLEIFLTNLGFAAGGQVSKKKFAAAFKFTVNQVQGWFGVNGEGMPASALHRIFEQGQSIDALLADGSVTMTKEKINKLFPARDLDYSAPEVINRVRQLEEPGGGTDRGTPPNEPKATRKAKKQDHRDSKPRTPKRS